MKDAARRRKKGAVLTIFLPRGVNINNMTGVPRLNFTKRTTVSLKYTLPDYLTLCNIPGAYGHPEFSYGSNQASSTGNTRSGSGRASWGSYFWTCFYVEALYLTFHIIHGIPLSFFVPLSLQRLMLALITLIKRQNEIGC